VGGDRFIGLGWAACFARSLARSHRGYVDNERAIAQESWSAWILRVAIRHDATVEFRRLGNPFELNATRYLSIYEQPARHLTAYCNFQNPT
jgi:hypothetical protein